ncbi:hypothetical protein [uncultured Microbulbifer sp.]|uniref:hypothetical protein n=1 Tax=uncultured Microbulbifer sp. TaxID=348147 RepID=UPI00263754DB|nr:hypothetical protein [uncultured Microbulbifer sp.]
MRIFKGFLKVGACLVALSSCQDAMKGNEIYPTVDNLVEIETSRVKIMEARNTDNGIQIVLGESLSNKCNIQIHDEKLGSKIVYNSLEGQPDGVTAKCQWNGNHFKQSRKHFTFLALRLEENEITIDLQLLDMSNKNYLAFTLLETSLSKQLKKTGQM